MFFPKGGEVILLIAKEGCMIFRKYGDKQFRQEVSEVVLLLINNSTIVLVVAVSHPIRQHHQEQVQELYCGVYCCVVLEE